MSEASVEDLVARQKFHAKERLLDLLRTEGPLRFEKLLSVLLEEFMIRETDLKDICVDLERAGDVERTWAAGNRKPDVGTVIELKRM